MIRRIVASAIVLVLALGCAFALAEDTAALEGKTRYISARKGLYIRATADLDAEIVATPDFNYTVKVIGEEGKWSHVIYESNGKTYEGYCWTAYLSNHKIVVKKTDEESSITGGQTGSKSDEINSGESKEHASPVN